MSETAAASLDRGTYEIVRDRLLAQARTLGDKTERLNARRLELFGGSELTVLGSERIRTENNCVPRDIVAVGDLLLFGYNVFFGLKSATTVSDVLSLHSFSKVEEEGGRTAYAFTPVAPDAPGYFLNDPQFVREFQELYQYYKGTRLLQLRRPDGKLLAVFQTGAALTDIKVFRWAVDPDGSEYRATYIDNRGERDHLFPPAHDFAWTATTRDDHRRGRHPHVSILDLVFVETIGGDLTVKVEDSTETGQGLYREPVDDPDQSLDDAEVHYAKLGSLILLKILPYREKAYRYLVFNTLTRQVNRIDAIGQACVQLPEDHGLIFPGGYYLRSGETKVFDLPSEGMEYKRVLRSPNGEDVLYVFHKRDEGLSVLLPYNLIRRQVQNPILCHGYSLFEDGTMVVFRAGSNEPTRVHTMQIWQTPFATAEHAARARSTGDYFERIGNAELVRGVSDLLSLRRSIEEQRPSEQVYEDLIAAGNRAIDSYHWLGREEVENLQADLKEILATCEVIVGEFEKVESLRKAAAQAVEAAERDLDQLAGTLRTPEITEWQSVDRYVEALAALRGARGRIISLREQRYADLPRLDALEKRAVERFQAVAAAAVELLQSPQSLAPFHEQLAAHEQEVETVATVAAAAPLSEKVEALGTSLELLTEVVGALPIADATVRTAILEALSEVLARLNRVRALLSAHRQGLLEKEGTAEFGAQIRLFGQAVAGALALADTPERADTQLSKLMLQLEELESRFSELDAFVGQLADKREEVVEAFAARKQALMDARQRRAANLGQAAARILEGIRRRAGTFASDDEVNAFFASDPMAAKARDLVAKLRELGDVVRADEIEGRIKATRQEAARALRDRRDLFEEGTAVLKLGRHRFSVNTQPLELAVVPRADTGEQAGMAFHLTGTDFYEPVTDPEFLTTRPYWEQTLISETAEVYRAEYLAFLILSDAEAGVGGLSLQGLRQGKLEEVARTHAAERYDEGYERGLHDHDAALILERLLALHGGAGLLRFGPRPRAFAALFWALLQDDARRAAWSLRAASLARLRSTFAPTAETATLAQELAGAVETFLNEVGIPVAALGEEGLAQAGAYLAEELAGQPVEFTTSAEAESLRQGFLARLESTGTARDFVGDLRGLEAAPGAAYRLTRSWLDAYLSTLGESGAAQRAVLDEAAVLLLTERKLSRRVSHAITAGRVEGLLGQHPRIEQRKMAVQVDEFLARLEAFHRHRVPGFRDYLARRHRLILDQRRRLRLDEFLPKVMSAFVRNKLIDQVYLPLIGDNLAKQLGTVGEGRRTDQMGLLLLLSPPGYGKTTLMEYVANRLGLVFMKVNGPALGHGVKSLDPAEAPNATSRQEVERINLALEMGNNVLLYLDDIQHTHSELLQKFISLCDAQRKIEGVWRGETRTYDLRGKRFCVCMAGNPYTESGERFRIPDMLANRADTFNLGDVLAGKEDLFALSYVENALTSNPALAPLAGRDLEDVHKLVRLANGEEISADQLAHPYSALELGEITGVLRRLIRVQDVLLRVNREYVRSASMEDAYRTEPRFQLQGSYRNMNKLAARIAPVMNDAELEAVVDDHYAAEAQTLTQGAEHNLLKLAEIRGRQTPGQAARWEEIKKSFKRVQLLGAADGDPVARVTGQLSLLSERMDEIGTHIAAAGTAVASGFGKSDGFAEAFAPFVEALHGNLEVLAQAEAKRRSEPEAPAPAPILIPPSNGNGGPDGFAPYLEKLDQTLAALSAAPRGTGAVQSLAPGVHEQLTEMVEGVGETLIPLLRGIARRLKSEVQADPQWGELLDRTFKNLDQLRDLAEALRKIDTRETRPVKGGGTVALDRS